MKSIIASSALAVFLTACQDTAISSAGAVDAGWEATVSRLLQEGDCRGAQAALRKVNTREPLWYEFMSRSYTDCRNEEAFSGDAAQAIAVINDGLKQFPDSSNLLLSRGYRHQELGRVDEALADFRAAETQARSNLSGKGSGPTQSEAGVADAAARAIRALETPASGRLQLEQQILAAIAEGKCEEAARSLEVQPVSPRADWWFHLSFVVGSYCESTSDKYRTMAQTAIDQGRKTYPESGLLLIDAGLWSERNGNVQEAIELYEQALRHSEIENYYQGGADAIRTKLAALRQDALKAQ